MTAKKREKVTHTDQVVDFAKRSLSDSLDNATIDEPAKPKEEKK